jgi:hypothetical protein
MPLKTAPDAGHCRCLLSLIPLLSLLLPLFLAYLGEPAHLLD